MTPSSVVGNGRPQGTGPGGRITPEDIRTRARQLGHSVDDQLQARLPLLRYAAVGGAALVVVAAYLLGRRRGRRRSTVVEIRRG